MNSITKFLKSVGILATLTSCFALTGCGGGGGEAAPVASGQSDIEAYLADNPDSAEGVDTGEEEAASE